jgi:hypothetical protein
MLKKENILKEMMMRGLSYNLNSRGIIPMEGSAHLGTYTETFVFV